MSRRSSASALYRRDFTVFRLVDVTRAMSPSVLIKTEHHHGAQLGRQGAHRPIHVQALSDVPLLAGEILGQLLHRQAVLVFPQISEPLVDQNAVKPGSHVSGLPQGVDVSQGLHHRVLYHVQRGVPVLDIGEGDPVEAVLMGFDILFQLLHGYVLLS